MSKYVSSGATLQCSMGTSQASFKATPKNISVCGKDQGNIQDFIPSSNIPSFGRCRSLAYPPTASATAANFGRLTPMPCLPGTCAPWSAVDPDCLLAGSPALREEAKLSCMYGGRISIVKPGQELEETGAGKITVQTHVLQAGICYWADENGNELDPAALHPAGNYHLHLQTPLSNGEKLTVTLGDKNYHTTVGEGGEAVLANMKPWEPTVAARKPATASPPAGGAKTGPAPTTPSTPSTPKKSPATPGTSSLNIHKIDLTEGKKEGDFQYDESSHTWSGSIGAYSVSSAKAVVVFEGSRSEKLGEGQNVFGKGAVLAKVTVYGPKGKNDIARYKGFTMSSDFKKYGAIDDGVYTVNYRSPGKDGALKSNWAVANTGPVNCLDGKNPSPVQPYSKTQKNGIYIHCTNNNGWAGAPVSTGCLLVVPSRPNQPGWAAFDQQLKAARPLAGFIFKLIVTGRK